MLFHIQKKVSLPPLWVEIDLICATDTDKPHIVMQLFLQHLLVIEF